jgi:hypothetical protein
MPLLDAIEAMSRVLALSDGRDPAEATRADRDKAVDFMNLYSCAAYWSRKKNPCSYCGGSGIEPQLVGKAHPPAVIEKTAA